MNSDNEIWDEFKWEEFMKEQDKKLDRYMELFYRYQDDPNCDEIIAREMGWTWLLEHNSEPGERRAHSVGSMMHGAMSMVCGDEAYASPVVADPVATARTEFARLGK